MLDTQQEFNPWGKKKGAGKGNHGIELFTLQRFMNCSFR